MDRLPLFLRLRDKRCLVVGGGVVAERKVRILLRTGAAVRVVAPVLNESLTASLDKGDIEHAPRPFEAGDTSGCTLVIAATNDVDVNEAVAAECDASGALCNVVDDNAASAAIVPAIIDRSPVVIAIGTGGYAPVLAQQLKSRIEAMLPSRLGELAKRAGRWRSLVKKRLRASRDRRRFWQRFFDGPIAERYLAGQTAAAEKLVRRDLMANGERLQQRAGEAWIVGAGPGDPSLVTLRAQQLISRADVVLYDRLVSPQILDFARKDAEMHYVGKSADGVSSDQATINELLVRHVSAGRRVCRLKGGDPFIFGRGGEEIRALADAGLPYQVVPGVSAAQGCAAYAGIPLTLRGVSRSVTFATARLDGGLLPNWPMLLKSGDTLCLYMAVSAIPAIRDALLKHGVAASLPVAFVEQGTTMQQRVVNTTVDDMAAAAVRRRISAPAVTYIGEVAAMSEELGWYAGSAGTTGSVPVADEAMTA